MKIPFEQKILDFNSYFAYEIDNNGIERPHYILVSVSIEDKKDSLLKSSLKFAGLESGNFSDKALIRGYFFSPYPSEYASAQREGLIPNNTIILSPNLGGVRESLENLISYPADSLPGRVFAKPDVKAKFEYPTEQSLRDRQSFGVIVLHNWQTERGLRWHYRTFQKGIENKKK